MSTKKSTSDYMRNQKGSNIFLLELPESAMVSILSHLSPIDLCIMSQVCTSLRDRCRSDHLWARLIKQKWGRVIGEVAYKEWQSHLTKLKQENLLNQHIQNGSLGSIGGVWPNLCLGSFLEDFGQLSCSRKNNSIMFMYISLETGKFWFPAQIYRGYMLVNALLSYDSKTDKFRARHQYRGWQFLGKSFSWDVVRLPPVETPSYVLHVSDCVDKLKPGDHIEIQCRVNKEMPYDWWYAVIGHLDSCDENEDHCRCYLNEMFVVEFKPYRHGSHTRRVKLLRTNYGEKTDSSGGCYGGIRKLNSEEDIERWKKITPPKTLLLGCCIRPVAAQFEIL